MDQAETTATAAANIAASNCFYATYGMIDSVDLLIHDARNILKNRKLNWINVAVYDPIHVLGNLSTTLQ